METEIESIDEEISALGESDTTLKEKGSINMERVDKEIVEAKKESDVVQGVYERAQKQVAAYNALPDDTLALQMRQLDEAEQDIIDDANRERGEFFERKLCCFVFFIDPAPCKLICIRSVSLSLSHILQLNQRLRSTNSTSTLTSLWRSKKEKGTNAFVSVV